MAKRKVLKSVARSVADSFTSSMNYRTYDYVMGHILNAVRETGETTLHVDLLQPPPPSRTGWRGFFDRRRRRG